MTEVRNSGESDVQKSMVLATIRLLADIGPEALQVRRIASAVGVSSMVVYSRFGGMPQLVEAVIAEGFWQLSARFAELSATGDPICDMSRLAIVYHEFGRANPHLYDLMFGLSTPGGYRQISRPARTPGGDGGTALDEAYQPLMQYVKQAIREKRFRRQDHDRVAAEIWSFVHGFTALELGGYFAQFEDPIVEVFASLITHVAVGLGDSQQRARKSVTAAITLSRRQDGS